MAIKRIWHRMDDARERRHENLLRTEVIPGIEAKKIPGYRGIEVSRLSL